MKYSMFGPLLVALAWPLGACGSDAFPFNADNPGRGPGELLDNTQPLNSDYTGGTSGDPEAAASDPAALAAIPVCDATCRDYCDGLSLNNPVDASMCRALWGVGLDTRPIDFHEACRRLHVDLLGEFPTRGQSNRACADGDWDTAVSGMLQDERFVRVHRRRWADLLRYNNTAVSIERIYDADQLVARLYLGYASYDEFAAVVSAHPVLTRRYDTAGDRVEALFELFLGRPPYNNERADMARLYAQWENGYFDHPALGMRLPDATLRFPCVTDDGRVDPSTKGQCTSVLWGYKEVILTPDYRALEGEMWSGLLTADEWHLLQEPGRIIASQLGFWEHAVDRALEYYLGYDLVTDIPAVRKALVEYVLAHNGDMRALHYAIATSQIYLQSSAGETETEHRYTHGPLKQATVETWIDSLKKTTGYDLGRCDHRMPEPRDIAESSPAGIALVRASEWDLTDNGIRRDYRDLARTLGGCPDNNVGGRFTTVSILTTATQESFVASVCNPALQQNRGAGVDALIPGDLDPSRAIDADAAEAIVEHQVRTFFGRRAREAERQEARDNATACTPAPCSVEAFARPVCYALLSSSEMLFY